MALIETIWPPWVDLVQLGTPVAGSSELRFPAVLRCRYLDRQQAALARSAPRTETSKSPMRREQVDGVEIIVAEGISRVRVPYPARPAPIGPPVENRKSGVRSLAMTT